uniref:Uncharacterized protein n=1 Tax=Mycena chlorophos TaxID=658473 RepID=A0ABQ0KWB3_MYCCL|nr:predicted protein [Mycena chlorophos]
MSPIFSESRTIFTRSVTMRPEESRPPIVSAFRRLHGRHDDTTARHGFCSLVRRFPFINVVPLLPSHLVLITIRRHIALVAAASAPRLRSPLTVVAIHHRRTRLQSRLGENRRNAASAGELSLLLASAAGLPSSGSP